MTWEVAEANFAQRFDRYEPRLPQRALATRIEGALAEGSHLLAQAACGVGKSYAGLVPAIDHAKATGLPVIAATATKALQDQYIGDCEALQNLYTDFRFTVLKGRSNYLCHHAISGMDETKTGLKAEALLAMGNDPEVLGDIDRLPITLTPTQKRATTSTPNECLGRKNCPFGEVCFSEGAKQRARDSHVVIVNHALLMIDAVLAGMGITLLPQPSAVLVDEAHELPGYATNALSAEFSELSLIVYAREAANLLTDHNAGDQLKAAAADLFDRFTETILNTGQKELPLTPAMVLDLQDELITVIEAVQGLAARIADMRTTNKKEAAAAQRLTRRADNLVARFQSIIMANFEDMVRWVERVEKEDRRTGAVEMVTQVHTAPLDVAPFLRAALWPQAPVVLTSATLALGTDFSYLANQLGLELNPGGEPDCFAATFDAGTPFDFTTQARTFIPRHMPEPKEKASFQAAVAANIGELVKAADGRALLLFTSWEGLKAAQRALTPMITALGHTVLVQGEAPTRALAQTFKADEHSVLFAVKSFFTGVDVVGDALRLVVIDKLPFAAPDVLTSARAAKLDAAVSDRDRFTKGAFAKMTVPEMGLTLVQGYGRLIRSTTDRGIVAILDSRLHTKRSYGPKVMGALPPAPVLTYLNDATKFLRELDDQPEASDNGWRDSAEAAGYDPMGLDGGDR
jgi:ATP-dependent DNA helicase DinG